MASVVLSQGARRSRGRTAALAAIVAAVGAWLIVGRVFGADAEPVATAYLAAWEKSNWERMRRLAADPPKAFVETHEGTFASLSVRAARFELVDVETDGDRATARFHARLDLGGLGDWRYEGRLPLVERDGEWRVRWTPAAVHPALRTGMRLQLVRSWPKRAPILDADGTPLAAPRAVIEVGVEPRRVKHRRRLLAALARYVDADPKQVAADLDAPGVRPNWFIPVVQLRLADYEEVKPKIYPVPGTVFRRTTARLLPFEGFAAHTIGAVGEVTADLLAELGEPYVAGDIVGMSGLERVYEERLAGRPSGEVQLVSAEGRVADVFARLEGERGEAVRTTLDRDVQAAAEEALSDVRKPAALVALDASSGEIRAAVSRPLEEFNRAFAARYPPGSTFKIVTTAALLESGVGLSDTVPCPEEAVVGGKPFRNAEGAALGEIPFRTAFSLSCNTAFVQLAARVGGRALAEEAREFGFGARYELPLDVAGGRFPAPEDEAEKAAAAIGQGRVEASPLHMATVAAAAASGSWRPPVLVGTRGGRGGTRVLAPDARSRLQELMRAVVADGTGKAADVPGEAVMGKTGTAEFGAGTPPRTHAWFAGFRGDLALAVVVEGGGFGGEVAAPIAARFLSLLNEWAGA